MMKADKIRIYIIALLLPLVVALSLLAPSDLEKNVALAVICVAYAGITVFLIRKRDVLNNSKGTVLLIMVVATVSMIALIFVMGAKFGFKNNPFQPVYIKKYLLPYTAIVISTEMIRRVLLAQKIKFVTIYTWVAFVMIDSIMLKKQGTTEMYDSFIGFVFNAVFLAISVNVLMHYVSYSNGAIPNVIFRLSIVLWKYLFPILPVVPPMLLSLVEMIIPLVVFGILAALYSKKKKTTSKKRKKLANAVFCSILSMAVGISMLISCQFSHGLLVIASPSMTGEIDVGDCVIYSRYNDEDIKEGQIIVFNKNYIKVVHRVVDVTYVDGEIRYFTKGDANESVDQWYVTKDEIVGKVEHTIKYIGLPTLALRSLF